MQEIDFEEIKKWLEYGEIAILAKENMITRASAYNILNGKTKNFSFIEKAMTKAFENKARIMNGQDRMKKISV